MKSTELKIYTKAFFHIIGVTKIITVVTLSLLVTIAEAFSIILLVPLLGSIILDENKANFTQSIMATLQNLSINPSLENILLLFLACAFFRSWIMKLQIMLSFHVAKDFALKIFAELYRLILRTKWSEFHKKHSSTFKQILMDENNRVEMLTGVVFTLLTRFLLTFAYLCFAAYLSFSMTLTITFGSIILFLLLRKNLRLISKGAKNFSQSKAKLYKLTDEHLAFFEMVKLFHQQDKFAAKLIDAKKDACDDRESVLSYRAQHQFLFSFGSSCLLCVFIFLAIKVMQLSPLRTVLFIAIFSRIATLLNGLQTPIKQILQYFPSFQRTCEIQQWCSEKQDEMYGEEKLILRKSIFIKNVSFQYSRDLILDNFSLQIPVQQTIAIVGESGAGKSTVANLLLGLISSCQGDIYIDNEKLSAANMKSWQQQIGYVPQKNYLLEGTLLENIQCDLRLLEKSNLQKVIEQSALNGLVEKLPLGLDSVISEKGNNLSGGEKQRIAIARCLIRNPNIIIFDEATSALDYTTESHILQSLTKMQQKTIIIITHRLSSIQHANLIHYIEGGKIVESGCWSELIQRKQHFYNLWQKQRK